MSAAIPPASASARPPPGTEEPAPERRTLRDYVIMLRERMWVALPIAVLVALGVGYKQASETPLYAAQATMQFKRPERVVNIEAVVDQSTRSDADLFTHMKVLQSQKIRDAVARSLTPEETKLLQRPWAAEAGANVPSGAGLLGSVSVEYTRGNLIVGVNVVHRDPEGAALVANRYVQQFIRSLIEDASGLNEAAVVYLRQRADELRRESEAANTRLQEYRRQHNLVDLDSNVTIVGERLRTINAELTRTRVERIRLEGLVAQIKRIQEAGGDLLETEYVSNYGTIPSLRSQLADLNRQQSILGERYLERHPRMIEVAGAIEVVRGQITRNIEQAIADLNAQVTRIREGEQMLGREYAIAEREQLRLGELSVEFKSLENQAAVARSNYVQILDRLNQTTTVGNLESIPVKPLDAAVPAGAPFRPRLQEIVRRCLILGVAVFLGVALGLSFLDDRVKSTWDVEGFIGANLLGIIPDLGDVPESEKHLLASGNQTTPGSEAFLGIYSAVKIQSKLDFPKAVLITSTIPGEGKTMISSNLAAAFARHGKKVLLLDCDMRRPMLHRHFKLTNEAGLITWFDAGANVPADPLADPALGIVKVEENLYLLRSGGRSKSPTELLEDPVFVQFVDALKRHFDLVIVDSPPMGAVTDALLLAERTDEVIYVCRFNKAYRKHIRLHIKQLRDSKNELLGVVLNGLSPRRIEYYSNYRYYRSYKKYYGAQS
ncbi:MAG TPA: polysaccharide biosynthesis tyrosine autokinase [Opitutaceae bacterium]|nr:polysaccharide biosynthesis tyrosine autokinase [Opitutaceae bacterium]